MEVLAAAGVIVSIPIIYRALGPRGKTEVECWFCHERTTVRHENKNSFTCPSCEQYNGFTEDGDYNRKIPGQTYTAPKRFCEPVKEVKKPIGFLDRFGGVNMSPKGANGLCNDCNLGQEKIMREISQFEPINEGRFNEELEDFRYRLERTYQLCPRCTIQVHGKLEEDKKKYSYLFELRHKLKRTIGLTLNEVMNPNQKKSRKAFFAGGTVCESLHAGCLVSTIFLFLATIDFLQQDAGASLVKMPKILQDQLPTVYSSSFLINFSIMIAHFVATFNNKCRVTLPDLLLPLIIIFSLATFLIPNDNHAQDVALIRCACASFSTVLSMAITLLPRKRLHKKRPNRMISSAFSVASTPTSQCSSQASRNASLLDHTTSDTRYGKSPYQRSPSISPPVRTSPTLFRDFTNAQFSNRVRENKENETGEAMDWDDSESVTQSVRSTTRSHFQPGLLARSRGFTNAHGLTPSVANMSILDTARPFDSPATPSVFSRQHRQMIQQNATPTPARSLFGPPRSLAASQIERTNYLPETNTRSGSVFTSVSQQDGHSMVSGAWQCRVLAILFALVFIVLIMQIALFYVLFTRK